MIGEGYDTKKMVEKMAIIPKKNDHGKINILERMEITKASSLPNRLNNIISGRNDPLYKMLWSLDRFLHDERLTERF